MNTKRHRDPVFAAIRDYKAAVAKNDKAGKTAARLEDFHKAAAPEHQPTFNPLNRPYPILWLSNAYSFTFPKDIDTHLDRYFATNLSWLPPKTAKRVRGLKDAARAELQSMLRAVNAEHRRKQKRAGLTAAWEEQTRTAPAAFKAMQRLFSTRPATLTGLAALVDFIRIEGMENEQGAIESIAAAVAGLRGH